MPSVAIFEYRSPVETVASEDDLLGLLRNLKGVYESFSFQFRILDSEGRSISATEEF